MGNTGGMYPYQQYPHGPTFPSARPSYGGYATYPMSYGRGTMPMQRPVYPPMFYGGAAPSPIYPTPNPIFGAFRSAPSGGGGLQSAPPSATLDGNIQLNRPGDHRPHFDHQ